MGIRKKVRDALAKERKGDTAGVLRNLRRVYTAASLQEAQAAWAQFRQRWGRVYPEAIAGWEEDLSSLSCFLRYLPAIHPYLRSTNLLERFIREVRRGTKVRDHPFPSPEAVEKLMYLECERQEGQWERRLRGFMEAQERLERMFQERYPQPQTMTQTL